MQLPTNMQRAAYYIWYITIYCASRGWVGAVSGLSAVTLWSVWHAALNSCWRWCMSNSMPLYAHEHLHTHTHPYFSSVGALICIFMRLYASHATNCGNFTTVRVNFTARGKVGVGGACCCRHGRALKCRRNFWNIHYVANGAQPKAYECVYAL